MPATELPAEALAAGAQLSTDTRAALKAITADARAVYDAIARGETPAISIGQWGRLTRAEAIARAA